MAQGGLAGAGPKAIGPGDEIAGRYVVEALLGRGGMGAVYRVLDRVLGERVALKTLTLETARQPLAQSRLRTDHRALPGLPPAARGRAGR